MKVQGLADGKHAVHIHEVGKCEPCASAGVPTQARSVVDTDTRRRNHARQRRQSSVPLGDMISRSRTASARSGTRPVRVTLSPGRLSVFDADGSSIIVHPQPDTYCDEETEAQEGLRGRCPRGLRGAESGK